MENNQSQNKTIIINNNNKSVGLSLLLTFFFGPFGMLYSTITGFFIMLILCFVIGLFTLGFGLILLWPIQMIWGAMAVSSHNSKNKTQIIHN